MPGAQSILKAEMMAINKALLDAPNESVINIYSDSLSAIRLSIPCRAVVRSILFALLKRTLHTRIVKVKAHKGIQGNKLADCYFKESAQ